ncbi:MAG: three-Cys-motif partner protein TcmP [Nitrospirota bacterium]|jgi:three-Cys-motif partner protein
MLEKLPQLTDDGLLTPEVGSWAERKYRLVWNYAKMFTTGMKNKWHERIYIDLFAGAGCAKIRESSIIVPASPLLALDIPDKFDKYIFCEQNESKLKALMQRVSTRHPDINAKYIHGDVTEHIDRIISEIPMHSSAHTVLSFCFIDPYKIDNFNFQVIKELSSKYVDFLILIPSYMDAHRNVVKYAEDTHVSIEDFTGGKDWKELWDMERKKGTDFGVFLPELFCTSMEKLGYLHTGVSDTILIRSDKKNLPLYHLAFFSRHQLGMKYWKESIKYSSDQGELF